MSKTKIMVGLEVEWPNDFPGLSEESWRAWATVVAGYVGRLAVDQFDLGEPPLVHPFFVTVELDPPDRVEEYP